MILFNRAILSARLSKPGDRFWYVADGGEFKFYHWLQIGHVIGESGIVGIQAVVGPLLIALSWRR